MALNDRISIYRRPEYLTPRGGWPELSDLRRGMDDLFNTLFTGGSGNGFAAQSAGAFQPAVDLWETPEAYIAHVNVPGVTKDDLDLEVTGSTFTLKGERKAREVPENATCHMRGIAVGEFQVSYTLPIKIDAPSVTADFKDGVLTVTLPKVEPERAKTVKVNVAETA